VFQRSWPSIYRSNLSKLDSPSFSMVKQPNLELPLGMYLVECQICVFRMWHRIYLLKLDVFVILLLI
jgi:hypothetical protein